MCGWALRGGATVSRIEGMSVFKDKTPEMLAQAAGRSPLERLGQPADIAVAVSFLAGTDGEWVNGQTIRVNGGFC